MLCEERLDFCCELPAVEPGWVALDLVEGNLAAEFVFADKVELDLETDVFKTTVFKTTVFKTAVFKG